MAEIKHRVGIKGSTGQIYSLLTTDKVLARWWTIDTQGVGEVGSIIHFHFAATEVNFEVIALINSTTFGALATLGRHAPRLDGFENCFSTGTAG
jgi:hypothetical protein